MIPPGSERRRVLISTSSVMTSNIIVAALGGISLAIMTRQLRASATASSSSPSRSSRRPRSSPTSGLNALTGREISRTPERAQEILGHTLGLRVSLSVLVVPVVALIAHFAYASSNFTLFLCVLIASFAIPFDALRSVSLSYFVASIRNHVAATVAILQQALFVGGVVVILKLGGGVLLCVTAYLASTVISSICAYVWVVREVPYRPRFSGAQWRRIFTGSLGIGLIQLVNVLYLQPTPDPERHDDVRPGRDLRLRLRRRQLLRRVREHRDDEPPAHPHPRREDELRPIVVRTVRTSW